MKKLKLLKRYGIFIYIQSNRIESQSYWNLLILNESKNSIKYLHLFSCLKQLRPLVVNELYRDYMKEDTYLIVWLPSRSLDVSQAEQALKIVLMELKYLMIIYINVVMGLHFVFEIHRLTSGGKTKKLIQSWKKFILRLTKIYPTLLRDMTSMVAQVRNSTSTYICFKSGI